ncbi:hypothetical protein TI39_contig287g00029 [Zymoseptoria brevis]|uniref:Uncharacterized protein n=1 Tax=Zymoseptoria brevis TaxID=1047168 RepID=A0A0F4GZD6_9PEZI|nr:hypothetical protein TI39_contig287g00029 [Zymoseptoria brevis]
MDTLLQQFIGLPIILVDYEALCLTKQASRTPTEAMTRSHTPSAAAVALNGKTVQIGLADSIDDLWDQMTSAMRAKVREACYEVLRRTDGPKEIGHDFDYDNDARFLD